MLLRTAAYSNHAGAIAAYTCYCALHPTLITQELSRQLSYYSIILDSAVGAFTTFYE